MPRDKQTGLLQENNIQPRQRADRENGSGTRARDKEDPHQSWHKKTYQVHQQGTVGEQHKNGKGCTVRPVEELRHAGQEDQTIPYHNRFQTLIL